MLTSFFYSLEHQKQFYVDICNVSEIFQVGGGGGEEPKGDWKRAKEGLEKSPNGSNFSILYI